MKDGLIETGVVLGTQHIEYYSGSTPVSRGGGWHPGRTIIITGFYSKLFVLNIFLFLWDESWTFKYYRSLQKLYRKLKKSFTLSFTCSLNKYLPWAGYLLCLAIDITSAYLYGLNINIAFIEKPPLSPILELSPTLYSHAFFNIQMYICLCYCSWNVHLPKFL